MEEANIVFLSKAGGFAIPIYAFNSVLYALFYGASIPVFLYAIQVMWARGFQSRASKFTMIAVVTCFAASTFHVGNNIGAAASWLKLPLFLSEDGTIPTAAYRLNSYRFPIDLGCDWAELFLVGMSDAVVVWRAAIFYRNQRWIIIFLVLLWGSFIGTGLAFLCFVSNYRRWYDWRQGEVPIMTRLGVACNYLTLATNAVATLLILLQLWQHRRFFRKIKIKSRSQKILSLLVETGGIFCLLQLVSFILQPLYNNHTIPPGVATWTVVDAVQTLFYCLSGIYPALVIVLLDAQKSVVDSVVLMSTL